MVDLSQHVLDMVQNSVSAGASRVGISITADTKKDMLTICIEDNGSGMTQETAEKALCPGFTTKKDGRGGMGIPLFKAAAEAAGGSLHIISEVNGGTSVTAGFRTGSRGGKPLGDIGRTAGVIIAAYPELELYIELACDDRKSVFNTEDVRCIIGDVPISCPSIVNHIGKIIGEQITFIFGGIQDENIS